MLLFVATILLQVKSSDSTTIRNMNGEVLLQCENADTLVGDVLFWEVDTPDNLIREGRVLDPMELLPSGELQFVSTREQYTFPIETTLQLRRFFFPSFKLNRVRESLQSVTDNSDPSVPLREHCVIKGVDFSLCCYRKEQCYDFKTTNALFLSIAILSSNLAEVKTMASNNPDTFEQICQSTCGHFGKSSFDPTYLAMRFASREILDEFFKHIVDFNIVCRHPHSYYPFGRPECGDERPIHVAIAENNSMLVRRLVSYRADVNLPTKDYKNFGRAMSSNRFITLTEDMPLFRAVRHGHEAMVRTLLELDADPNSHQYQRGRTDPLTWPVTNYAMDAGDNIEIKRMLRDAQPSIFSSIMTCASSRQRLSRSA